LRDRQLDRPHPRVPRPQSIPVAVGVPVARALVAVRADEPRHLALHQRLGQDPNALTEDVPVLLLEQLADERGKIHLPLGHRLLLPSVVFGRTDSGEDVRWPLLFHAAAASRFPPRPGTLPTPRAGPSPVSAASTWRSPSDTTFTTSPS